ncbi:MAG: cysteine desulfurase family protein [Pseudomonadota bacterium]
MVSKSRIYLDYNASAPLLPKAREAMLAAMEIDANPSSVHAEGRAARSIVKKARRQVAALVNTKDDHVVFTSGATEAAVLALTPHYSMGRAPVTMSRLYVCAADHPCTLEGGQFPEADRTLFPVKRDGLVDLDQLNALLSQHDHSAGLPLIVCHYANNETGVIQPVEEISRIVKANRGVFVLDAVQAAGRIKIDMAKPMADYLIVSSHKIGGPKGAGALIAHADLMMPMPLIRGGGQERGHRSGTESPVNLAGFGAAASIMADALADWDAVAARRDRLEAAIAVIAPHAIFYGRNTPERLPNTLFFGLPGMKAETLQIAFDLAGVSVSPGSACSSGKVGQSHVLNAMGVPSNDGAIRISLGLHNTDDEIAKVIDIFGEIAARAKPAA